MDPRDSALNVGNIEVQLKNLDWYLNDMIYNVHRRKLVEGQLKRVVQSFDERQKFAVIEKYITTKPSELASIIDWFEIKDSNKLLNIANRIIANNGYICGNIEKFRIQDEAIRINIAQSDMKHMPSMLMKSIDKFNITNQDAILSLAKVGFSQNEHSFCENFDKFKIQDEAKRLEFLTMLSNENLELIPQNIGRFNITSQDTLIKIARYVAEKSYDNNISRYIANFNIQDERERVNIAKIVAHKEGSMLAQYIKKYDIHDNQALLEILEEAVIAANNPIYIAPLINNFGATQLKDINNVFNIIMSHEDNPEKMITKLKYYRQNLEGLTNMRDIVKSTKNLNNIKLLYKFYSEEMDMPNFNMQDILGQDNSDYIMKLIHSQKEERTRRLSIEITEKILFTVSNLDFSIQDRDSVARLIIDLINIRSLKLKRELLPLSVKLLNDNDIYKIAQEIQASDKKKAYPALYAVVFNKLLLYNKESRELLSNIRKVFNSNNFVKDSKVLQSTLIGLIKLERAPILNQQRENILSFLIKEPKSIKDNIRYISLIMEFGTAEVLQGINANSEPNILQDMFYEICKKYLGTDIDMMAYRRFVTIPQNEERSLENLILTYVAEKNSDDEVMVATRKFIRTMSDINRFRDMRYDTASSPHLLELSQKGDVYQKWISGENTEEINEAVVSDDPVDLFLIGTEVEGSCQSVFYQGELNSCLMGYVIDGKNKAVVIKNEQGKIMARCIIRLLIEKDSNDVVMVREKLYKATGVDDNVIETINERCINYAQWLGVSLVCADENSKDRYTNTLVSKGGQAPSEYVDVLGKGVLGDEEYQVTNRELAYLYKR